MSVTAVGSLVAHGVGTCPGCGLEIAFRSVVNALGRRTIVVIPPGCAAVFSGYGRQTAVRIPGFQGNLGSTAAYASGIRAGLDAQGKHDVTVLGFAGDGATVDIGWQALSGALERGDRIMYVCYDNEGYMNTGGQASGSTTSGAVTTTTPGGKMGGGKDMLRLVAAHGIPYAATASVGYVDDLVLKANRARDCGGPAYLHVHTPCPTGWGFGPDLTVEMARLAVRSLSFNLVEVDRGRWRLTFRVRDRVPVSEYICRQRRFRHLPDEEVERMQAGVTAAYAALEKMCAG
ncbi:MAG: thiamine pyrophosphate-dependent enzyme [Bacillota bacterium]|nr:thiamine pyrophosphate-dependent enzyme [Bacillota bacterium]